MPIRVFNFPGPRGGFVSDSSPFALLPTEWSDCNNIRFHNRSVQRISGEESLYGTTALTTTPFHLQFMNGFGGNDHYYYVDNSGDTYRIGANSSSVSSPAEVTQLTQVAEAGELVSISATFPAIITLGADPDVPLAAGDTLEISGITGATDYNGNYGVVSVNQRVITTNINGTSLTGTPVYTNGLVNRKERFTASIIQMNIVSGGETIMINDGQRTPQYLATGPGNTTRLRDIPGWNYTVGTEVTADVIRPFKYVQVAGGITMTPIDGSAITSAPGTIRVSNRAAPGALPTWDPGLATADTADEFELAEGGNIIDMVSLGDTLCVFTSDTIYGLRVGTSSVTSTKLLEGRGMLSSHCGIEFFGKIFVVGNEDIYIFQGGAATQSIADERVRDFFFSDLDSAGTSRDRVFVMHNEREDEIWVCYPSTNNPGNCNRALIWNYSHNSWSLRDLPNVITGCIGPRRTVTGNMGQFQTFNYNDLALQLPGRLNDFINTMDVGNQMFQNGTSTAYTHEAFVERRGLDLAPDSPNYSKNISNIEFKLVSDGDVDIAVRASNTPNQAVDLTSTTDTQLQTRVLTTTGDDMSYKVSPRTNGKFMNIRIAGSSNWQLIDYAVDFSGTDTRVR